jgi:hypothetical protein
MCVMMGGTPVGAPIVGWVGEMVGARWAVAAGGIVALAAGLGALLVQLRRRGAEPAAQPDAATVPDTAAAPDSAQDTVQAHAPLEARSTVLAQAALAARDAEPDAVQVAEPDAARTREPGQGAARAVHP